MTKTKVRILKWGANNRKSSRVPAEVYDAVGMLQLIEERQLAIDALNTIACWSNGPEVGPRFDSPGDARIAREALLKLGVKPPKTPHI